MKTIIRLSISACILMYCPFAQSVESIVGEESHWSLSLSCTGCHGTSGQSISAIPSIHGMDKMEFIRKLRDFKAGNRPASVMDRIARGYNDDDFEKMAIFFNTQRGGPR